MSSEASDPGSSAAEAPAQSELRRITDARTMRALAHPVRIALIEALSLGGAMTATQVGERIGESPTTCSFHLRQLARYGFVEEAGGGRGRSRPWRMTSIGFQLPIPGDTETEVAADALLRMLRERQLRRFHDWQQARAAYPRQWREAAGDSQYLFYLTAAELAELSKELNALLSRRFRKRLTDPSRRPPGSLPVELLLFSYPIAPPPPGDGGPRSADGAG